MEAADETNDSRTLGQLFAAERERQGLSRAEVAQRLHMSAWQVEALEADDYARLPKGTFLRGFVRNCAKALNLDADVMLARLASSGPKPGAPGIVVPSQNIHFDPLGGRLSNPYVKAGGVAVVLLAFALAALYWWLFIRETPPGGMVRKSTDPVAQNLAAAPMPAPEAPAPRSAPIEMPVTPPAAETRKAETPRPQPPAPKKTAEPLKPAPVAAQNATPAVTPVSNAAAASARRLKLRFKGESWVEIRDRNGKILLSRLNLPGSEAEVSGRPPLNVVIGNAPDVQVTYEDREFPLEPHTRVAVARFTVE